MKLINKDADYAIKALVELAGRGGRTADVTGLAGPLGLPRPYLRKIMQALGRGGLVLSTRGKGGGFVLARPAAAIRLTDVIRVFQGPVKIHDCIFKARICPDVRTCPLRKTLDRLEAELVAGLEGVTVATLAAERSGRSAGRKRGGKP
ncbi:MAG: Rrf2 family transcriptional regulator [Candidatus Aminicenantes bacterium]|jgi:Rrf2 family protein|nr:Rrf2 family transcriptional regulator [Candidatus Aminicenantes bacterium]NLH77158.1 Rrf2 family transcriptional regulator [Acidobacteriota bacterium]